MARQKVYSVEIKPLYLCNQRCLMCPYEKDKEQTMSWPEVEENLNYVKDHFEFDVFDLSGGEPTIYPHFWDILDWLKINLPGQKITLATNGVKLAEEEFVRRLSLHKVSCFVSFHAPDEETSRVLTGRNDHHAKLLQGLAHLEKYNIPIRLNIVLTRFNQDRLAEINKLISPFPLTHVHYRLPHLFPHLPFADYKPDIVGLLGKIRNSFRWLRIMPGSVVQIDNFPDCFFGQEKLRPGNSPYTVVFLDKNHQKENYGSGANYEAAIDGEKYHDHLVKRPQCGQCAHNGYCPGINQEYLDELHRHQLDLMPTPPLPQIKIGDQYFTVQSIVKNG